MKFSDRRAPAALPTEDERVHRHKHLGPTLHGRPASNRCDGSGVLGNKSELVTDLVLAETICVLASFYKEPRVQIADAVRSLLALHNIVTVDPALLLSAVEVYEADRLDFAEAFRHRRLPASHDLTHYRRPLSMRILTLETRV